MGERHLLNAIWNFRDGDYVGSVLNALTVVLYFREAFAAKIFDYIELLNEIVPEMKQDLLEIHNFREEDMIFGEICFEIHSE